MSLTASVLDDAGSRIIEASRTGPADRPRELGRAVALELLAQGRGRDHRAQPARLMSVCISVVISALRQPGRQGQQK